ncbi:YdhK family protein [Planococcus sp. ISL-109]|uniref:YdhK family protein n=1 Tax=Planococcus sp. ISL-109 TaxID=2819166 RepID=UPI001BEC3D0D|nr:YdhK family protein [Planococcus sp. ISL-109]MBT2581255.1 YdhK family protein [Planococcus sp. ISL-109]
MAKNKLMMSALSVVAAVALGACNANDTANDMNEQMEDNMGQDADDMYDQMDEFMDDEDGHMGMDHSGSGEVPDNLQEAQNPTYEVGSQAIIETDHMQGMMGAEATIAGAYDTTVYAVSYTPEDGGDPIRNHKWVIHEELEDAGGQPFAAGDEVVLDADHMQGMDGATATVDSAQQTTVYMVDFDMMGGGDRVMNHKWVTEDELSPVE